MYRVLWADKDAYITNRVVNDVKVSSGNTGGAGSLDLFKLYGITSSGSIANLELSRLLIHFDLDPLRELITSQSIDITNPSFNCRLQLFDVYGGQTTPHNFTTMIHPLSRSFDEGLGRDVVMYSDDDVCNFLTGSRAQGLWIMSGAGQGGHVTGSVDYITSMIINNATSSIELSQLFITGEENLDVDVTTIISATLEENLPDEGFRIALTSSLEDNNQTYFVKRFASRTAYNEDYHPRLVVRFDDSIQDDSQSLTVDSSGSVFFYNYNQGQAANLVSGTTEVTGDDSLILKLETAISGGFYNLVFTGSQHNLGMYPVNGVYSASVIVPSTDSIIAGKLKTSGSVDFIPIWGALDDILAFHTGSKITAYPSKRGGASRKTNRYAVSVLELEKTYRTSDSAWLRVNIFDNLSPLIKLVKTPAILPGIIIRDVHYQIRDAATKEIVIPFDTTFNSTRVSSDSEGMFCRLDMINLRKGRSYVIDIMINENETQQIHYDASAVFRVNDLD